MGEPPTTARLVVLASGNGSNAQALIDACAAGELDAHVAAVVTNKPKAGVIDRAARAGVSCTVIDHSGKTAADRAASDQRLIAAINVHDPDLVVMAGWMRILGAEVGAAFPVINLHPARPGEFPGTRAIERAFNAYMAGEITESGVMVHWVPDAGVDVGPVVLSATVPFAADDTLDSFEARMHECEHQLIVAATRQALATLDT